MKPAALLPVLAALLALPAGAEVLSLDDPPPAALADRVPMRVAGGPDDVPGGALVHAARLPDAPVLAALPADALLVLGDCAADAEAPPLAVAIPQACDPVSLASGLAAADAAGPAGRIAALRGAGFRVIDAAPPAADGGLVIRAMPMQGLPDQSSGLIVASLAPAPFQPVTDAAPAPGLPQPSVVLGDMAVLMTAGERGPLGLPHPAREAIRQRDAAMFDRLLGQGAFDPDDGQAPAAIQTELARMACYGGRIDGDWGGGSDAALGRYVAAGGAGRAGADPDRALFRAIAGADSVTCAPVQTAAPAPVPAASGAAARSRPQSAGGGQPARARAPAAARQPAPAAPPAQGRQINRGLVGTGVFR